MIYCNPILLLNLRIATELPRMIARIQLQGGKGTSHPAPFRYVLRFSVNSAIPLTALVKVDQWYLSVGGTGISAELASALASFESLSPSCFVRFLSKVN